MKSYDEYKETEYDLINKIPNHWKLVSISRVCSEQKIKNKNGLENNVLSLSYGNIIRKKNIDSGLVPSDYTGYQIVYPNNIIMRLTDLQNDHRSLRTGLVKEKGIITSAYLCLKSSNLSKFIYYLLHSYDTKKIYYGMGNGIRQSIGYDDIKKLLIPQPPLEEQKQIVRYLDSKTEKINKLVQLKKKEVELLKEYRQALITKAVTKGIHEGVKMKDSGVDWIGEIPEDWGVGKLKYLADKIGDGLHGTPEYDDNGSYFFVNGNNLGNKYIQLKDDTKRINQNEYKIYKSELTTRTILISLNGTVGNLSYYNLEPIILSKSAGYISLKNIIDKNYVYYYLKNDKIKELFTLSFAGTTINNLSLETLRSTIILLPPVSEQKEIASYLDKKCSSIDKLISEKQSVIEKLSEYKTRLISDTVTGKIDVRDIKIDDSDFVEEETEEEIIEETENPGNEY